MTTKPLSMSERILWWAIVAWQADEFFHPLTCGVDSQNHPPLVPIEVEGFVRLGCAAHDCNYQQVISQDLIDMLLTHYSGTHLS